MRMPCLELILYFVLAYAISWSCWIPLAWKMPTVTGQRGPLYLLGGCGPLASAFLIAASCGGFVAVQDLLSRLWRRPIRPAWYLVACLLVPSLAWLAQWLPAATQGARMHFPYRFETVLGFVLLAAIPLIEEVGWRGFALPRLQFGIDALPSSLTLGALWACWHLPL